MSIRSMKEYVGVPRDLVENYAGKQLMFTSWDHHLLFASPFVHCVDPKMSFKDFVAEVLLPLLVSDPDTGEIDWKGDGISWLKSNKPWQPDWSASIADNGIRHKEQLRFKTSNLNTICSVS